MRLLIVEDSERLQRSLALALQKRGYAVDVTGDGTEALWQATETPYDLILLDVMLPGMDGFAVLKTLRERQVETPVLMLTAKGEVSDRVAGLEAGADDYLPKPFALEELLARVDTLVRRRYANKNPRIQIGDLELDTAARLVRRGEEAIALTPREYRLLEYLGRRVGEVVTKTEIEAHVYNEEKNIFSNAVESAISTLRKKLWPNESNPPLQTRRGLGYVLEPAR
ncbi:MAG TPA: response regulator transcription factor [Verrucomicrobiae bacterium]